MLVNKRTVHDGVPVWPAIFVKLYRVSVFVGFEHAHLFELPDYLSDAASLLDVHVALLRRVVVLRVCCQRKHEDVGPSGDGVD